MTLQEIQASDKPILRPVDIAPILQCDPQYIRDIARSNPVTLGFPVLVMGKRVKIPRIPFLQFLGYKEVSQ